MNPKHATQALVPAPSLTEMEDALNRIRASSAFASSEKGLSFLEYIVAFRLSGDTSHLKETRIGQELFNRPADYDPKADSVVRTQAQRVRERLKRYYDSEGAQDPVRIILEKGGYVPSFQRVKGEIPPESPGPAVPFQAAPARRSTSWVIWVCAAGVILAIGAHNWQQRISSNPAASQPLVDSPLRIAVLPFRSLRPGPEGALYGRALADSVIAWLTQSERVSVVTPLDSQTGVMQSAISELDTAKKLNAHLLLTGEISRADRQSRVWVRLTNVKNGDVHWAQSFTFAWADLLQLEESIGAAALRTVSGLTGSKATPVITPAKSHSPEALEAYLHGHYAALNAKNTWKLEAYSTADRNLKRALELEPGYPDALAELAELSLHMVYPWMEKSPAYLKDAENYATAALDRAPGHAKAISSLAKVAIFRHRPLESLALARRAVKSEPANALAIERIADAYEALGLYEAAIAIYGQLVRKQPAVMDPYLSGIVVLARMRQFDEAIAFAKPCAQIDAESPLLPFSQGYVANRRGNFAAAERWLRPLHQRVKAKANGDIRALDRFSYVEIDLALAEVGQGHTASAREVLRRLGSVSSRSLDGLTLLTAALGMRQEALNNIELGHYQHNYRYLVTEPGLAPLYGEPGFRRLLEETYPVWLLTLDKTRDSLPAPPPHLPTPAEFIASHKATRAAPAN